MSTVQDLEDLLQIFENEFSRWNKVNYNPQNISINVEDSPIRRLFDVNTVQQILFSENRLGPSNVTLDEIESLLKTFPENDTENLLSIFVTDLSTSNFIESSAMKSPPPSVETDDCDDIFGPPRTYPGGYCPPKNRPSMISPKYRLKEERRKVLKISLNKLKKIEDAERSLRRSVLINNTVKRLQQEVKEEKCQKYFSYPRCFDNDNYMSLKNDRTEENQMISPEPYTIDNDLDTVNKEVLNIVEENLNGLSSSESYQYSDTSAENTNCSNRLSSRKRSFDDMEDCDVQDVLSQFYMPPTPRMLTCIDDDEDVNVVDDEPSSPKKVKADSEQPDSEKNTCDSSVANFNVLQNNTQESRLRYSNSSENDNNSLSCGQASMFSEFQSNVFHNLIASLET